MCQQLDRLLRASLVNQKLAELLERGPVVGIVRQNPPEHLFRFRVLILEAVETREPQQGIGVVRFDFQDGLKLLDGLRQIFLLHFARAHVAECADVNAGQQSVRIHIVRINLQRILSLNHGVANMLRLRVDFRQTLHNHRGTRIELQSLLVGFDGLRRELRAGRHLVLPFLQVARREVVESIRAGGIARSDRAGRSLRSRRCGCLSGRLRRRSGRAEQRDQQGQQAGVKDCFHNVSREISLSYRRPEASKFSPPPGSLPHVPVVRRTPGFSGCVLLCL